MLNYTVKFFALTAVLLFLFFPSVLPISGEEGLNGGVPVEVGGPAPDFTLLDQNGTAFSLSQFFGEKNVILYFYPMDDTPGCTKEACSFRDDYSVFDSMDTVILGVSVDDVSSHEKFAKKFGLNFPILADSDKEVSKRYDTLSFYGKSKRSTFVIDKRGIIRFIYRDVDVGKHSGEVAHFIQENLE